MHAQVLAFHKLLRETKSLDDIIALTVGQVVDFVVASQAAPSPGAPVPPAGA